MPSSLLICNHPASRDDLLRLIDDGDLFTQIFCARDGLDALELLRKQAVDVIFVDGRSSRLDALGELVEKLQERDDWCDIPVLLFSRNPYKKNELEALEQGVSGCLARGITTRELVTRLLPHLSHKKRTDALREENTQLAKLAITDHLTGLCNRTYFDLIFDFESVRSQKQETFLSVMILSVDQIDLLTRQLGHEVIDRLLSLIGGIIRDNLRATDIPCRFSHHEFAVILPETAVPDGYRVAERIRQEFSRQTGQSYLSELRPTLSIGISGKKSGQVSGHQLLLEEAFCAVELGRHQGNNRTEIFRPREMRSKSGASGRDLDHPQGHA